MRGEEEKEERACLALVGHLGSHLAFPVPSPPSPHPHSSVHLAPSPHQCWEPASQLPARLDQLNQPVPGPTQPGPRLGSSQVTGREGPGV